MSTATIHIRTTCPYCACSSHNTVLISTTSKTKTILRCRRGDAGCGKIYAVVAGKMPAIKAEKTNQVDA